MLYRAIIVSIISFFFNEFLFYDYELSFFINTLIFCLPFLLYKSVSFYLKLNSIVLFTGVLLRHRPREIHLIPISSRGDFDYYSFLSQKAFLLTFHSLLIILGLIILLLQIKKLKSHIIFNTFIILCFVGFIVGLFHDQIEFSFLQADIRWIVTLFVGINIGYKLSSNNTFYQSINYILLSGVVLTIFNLIYDTISNDFKYKYSSDLIFLIPLFGILMLNKSKIKNIFLFIIPVTRTDIILYLLLILNKIKLSFPLILTTLITVLILSLYNFDQVFTQSGQSFTSFILRESGLASNSVLDKSLMVRIYELQSLLNQSFVQVMFGNGFGSFFELDNVNLTLDQSDFSKDELVKNKFSQPHTFISYLILKIGIIGFIAISYLTFTHVKGGIIIKALLSLCFLTSFYWVPLSAYIWGIYLGVAKKT